MTPSVFSWFLNTNNQTVTPNNPKTTVDIGLSRPPVPVSQTKKPLTEKFHHWMKGAAQEVGLSSEYTTPEATCLRICIDAMGEYKPFNWDSMSYLLTQLPSIERVEFVEETDTDALLLIPDLPAIICQLKQFFPSVSVLVCTSGSALDSSSGIALLKSPLDELRIHLEGYQLSTYKALTGKTTGEFIALQETVYRYITQRKQLGRKARIACISVSYVLNNYQYQKDVPEMLKQAEQLGVDAVHFSNKLPATAWFKPLKDEASVWFEAITNDNQDALAYFNTFPAEDYRVAITWPTIWEDPSEGFSEVAQETPLEAEETPPLLSSCTFPLHTVSVNLGFQASGCPRWQVGSLAEWHPVWRGDFWQNTHFKQLRAVHAPEALAFQDETTGELVAPVGFEACKRCPNRYIACDSAQIAPVNQHLLD
ncbi:MAG: radical SAM protein [Candidatus Melainabacteria bacterium]|jgi:hypothetical protein|nr:radical SAM protein [Candidatus Melainabacteria bacterium]